MTDEEELNLKREEDDKLDEEGDRLFLVRLGRLALFMTIGTPAFILPGFAAWRALETYCQDGGEKPFFWNNFGWLLLNDLYVVGVFGALCALIYLGGGKRGLKLCGVPYLFSGKGKVTEDLVIFLTVAYLSTFYIIFVGIGMFGNTVYVSFIK